MLALYIRQYDALAGSRYKDFTIQETASSVLKQACWKHCNTHGKHSSMKQRATTELPAAMLERLIARVNPHRANGDSAREQMQRLAGRWLLWQRLMRGVRLEGLASHAQLPISALILLEAGLADIELLPRAAWPVICDQLSTASAASGRVLAVLQCALGIGDIAFPGLSEQLVADIALAEEWAALRVPNT